MADADWFDGEIEEARALEKEESKAVEKKSEKDSKGEFWKTSWTGGEWMVPQNTHSIGMSSLAAPIIR